MQFSKRDAQLGIRENGKIHEEAQQWNHLKDNPNAIHSYFTKKQDWANNGDMIYIFENKEGLGSIHNEGDKWMAQGKFGHPTWHESLYDAMKEIHFKNNPSAKASMQKQAPEYEYENLFFAQGDDAVEYLNIIDEKGPDALIGYLNDAGALTVGGGDKSNKSFHSVNDNVKEFKDGWIVSWNENIPYVGIEFKKELNKNTQGANKMQFSKRSQLSPEQMQEREQKIKDLNEMRNREKQQREMREIRERNKDKRQVTKENFPYLYEQTGEETEDRIRELLRNENLTEDQMKELETLLSTQQKQIEQERQQLRNKYEEEREKGGETTLETEPEIEETSPKTIKEKEPEAQSNKALDEFLSLNAEDILNIGRSTLDPEDVNDEYDEFATKEAVGEAKELMAKMHEYQKSSAGQVAEDLEQINSANLPLANFLTKFIQRGINAIKSKEKRQKEQEYLKERNKRFNERFVNK